MIKRVTKYVYDTKSSIHMIKLEERYPHDQLFMKTIYQLKYFKTWLESLGDYRAFNMANRIELYITNFFRCEGYTDYLCSVLNDTDYGNNKKHFLKIIPDQMKNYIAQRPYLFKKHQMKAESINGDIIELGCNDIASK